MILNNSQIHVFPVSTLGHSGALNGVWGEYIKAEPNASNKSLLMSFSQWWES